MLRPDLLYRVAHGERDDRPAMLSRRCHHVRDHFLCQKRPNRIVHDDDFRFIRNMFEGIPNGVLPFPSTRNHFGDFRKSVPHGQIVQTVIEIGLRYYQNNLIDTGRGLEHAQRMNDERLTA